MESSLRYGSCLCSGVKYSTSGALRSVIACHCRQCRKTTGHFLAATAVAREHFTLLASDSLSWYHSSEVARRGFCSICGSTLFWDAAKNNYISIAAGTFDTETNVKITQHIFVADKGDYYDIGE